ncbi:MAG: YlxR family protein [Ruminococcaceae bacterium]|nr:YlxR family protein [Oscillospiraceae bacterium]
MSIPLRMCVVCRQMKAKSELLRIVKKDGEFSMDISGKLPGRGAYICRSGDCCQFFEKQRSFERAFKGAVPPKLKENVKKELIK